MNPNTEKINEFITEEENSVVRVSFHAEAPVNWKFFRGKLSTRQMKMASLSCCIAWNIRAMGKITLQANWLVFILPLIAIRWNLFNPFTGNY